MTHEIITQDGGDTYAFTATGSTVDFTAPASNQGGSLREFYWDPTSVFYADQESCNRWDTVMDESTPEAVASRRVLTNGSLESVSASHRLPTAPEFGTSR